MINDDPIGAAAAPWTPEERKVWLATHNAPKDYNLVTTQEMLTMGNSMNQQRQQCADLNLQFLHVVAMLQEYWKLEPDLVNAVGHAVFDAQRFKKAVDEGLPKLKSAAVKFDSAIKSMGARIDKTGMEPIEFTDMILALGEIAELMTFLELQQAKRRQRSKVAVKQVGPEG